MGNNKNMADLRIIKDGSGKWSKQSLNKRTGIYYHAFNDGESFSMNFLLMYWFDIGLERNPVFRILKPVATHAFCSIVTRTVTHEETVTDTDESTVLNRSYLSFLFRVFFFCTKINENSQLSSGNLTLPDNNLPTYHYWAFDDFTASKSVDQSFWTT